MKRLKRPKRPTVARWEATMLLFAALVGLGVILWTVVTDADGAAHSLRFLLSVLVTTGCCGVVLFADDGRQR